MLLYEDEVAVDEITVRSLLRSERPELSRSVITLVGGGTDNTMYRVGSDHLVRLPRTALKVPSLEKELTWLPRLRSNLPVTIPTPVHVGAASDAFPFPWALFEWIEGEEASAATITDWASYGLELARFVHALHATDLMGATRSGGLCWYRGGTLNPNNDWPGPDFAEIHRLGMDTMFDQVDFAYLEHLWDEALLLPEPGGEQVWLHADLKPTNVLVLEGRLHAVIDFGALSVGYPDAEHAITWDLPPSARAAYRLSLNIDDESWARARGWALALGINGLVEYWTKFPAVGLEALKRLEEISRERV